MVRRDSTANGWARGVCIAVVLMGCSAAHAQVSWHGSLGVTSDYVRTGLSLTRGASAIQGGLRADFDGQWSLGVWGSQIDPNRGPGATYEIDAYLAHGWRLTPDWIATATATHYFFPNDTPVLRYDYDELALAVIYRSQLVASVIWSPNTSGGTRAKLVEHKDTWAYELTFNQPIVGAWSGNAGVGRRDLSALFGESYWYAHAGISYALANMSLHLTYACTDGTAERLFGTELAANTLIGAVIWKFGSGD